MLCVILQPSYIPWRGYFDQIRRADTFVFLDTAPYDARGWRNRNRIKSADGSRWLTIPVQRKGSQQARTPLSEIRIHWEHDWRVTHRRSLEHAYARAPHWKEMTPLLDRIYGDRHERLVDLTIHATHCVASQLGLGETRFLRASELDDVPGEGSERIQTLLNRVGADRYLTGPSAQNYLDIDALNGDGIEVEFMAYDYPEYPQLHPPFDPEVSILDLLFNAGPLASSYFDRDPDAETR